MSGRPRLLVVVPHETDPPARLGEWLAQAGLELDERRLGVGDDLRHRAGRGLGEVLRAGGGLGAGAVK